VVHQFACRADCSRDQPGVLLSTEAEDASDCEAALAKIPEMRFLQSDGKSFTGKQTRVSKEALAKQVTIAKRQATHSVCIWTAGDQTQRLFARIESPGAVQRC